MDNYKFQKKNNQKKKTIIIDDDDSLIEINDKKKCKTDRSHIEEILNYSYLEIKRRDILMSLKEKKDEKKIDSEKKK